jgi:hypothetical protein
LPFFTITFVDMTLMCAMGDAVTPRFLMTVGAGLHIGIAPVSMSVITRLLAGHGGAVVAGFGVASRIESMILMIIFALSMSLAPFVGRIQLAMDQLADKGRKKWS